jgi:hypothetical protein
MRDLNVFYSVIQFVWPLLAAISLIVSLEAKQRHPGLGSTLMVAGSTLVMLISVIYLTRNFGLRYEWVEYDDYSMFFVFSDIFSVAGQLLFLMGLRHLIKSIITIEERPMLRY